MRVNPRNSPSMRRLHGAALRLVAAGGLALALGTACGGSSDDDDDDGAGGGNAGESGGGGNAGNGAGGAPAGGGDGAAGEAAGGAAAGEGGAAGGQGVPDSIPFEEYDKWLAEASCVPLWTCCPDKAKMNPLNGTDIDRCRLTRKAQFTSGRTRVKAFVDGGTVTYDAEALTSCVKAKLAFACDDGLDAWQDITCDDFLLATLEIDEGCQNSAECKDSYCDGETKECVALKADDEVCEGEDECGSGRCAKADDAEESTCMPPEEAPEPADLCEAL